MAYALIETSKFEGNPIELYYFSRNGEEWRFTSADYDFDDGGDLPGDISGQWLSRSIKRSSVGQGLETVKNSVKLEVAPNFEIVDQFRGLPDPGVIAITIIRLHPTDEDFEYQILWTGRVLGSKIEPDRAELNCEPVTISLKRSGLRRLYSKVCTHVLYGNECKVVKNPVSFFIVGIDGLTLTLNSSTGQENNFAGGYIEDLLGLNKIMIESSDGGNKILLSRSSNFEVGDFFNAYTGCNHTTTDCNTKYVNIENFGGFPWIPNKNPFDTGVF